MRKPHTRLWLLGAVVILICACAMGVWFCSPRFHDYQPHPTPFEKGVVRRQNLIGQQERDLLIVFGAPQAEERIQLGDLAGNLAHHFSNWYPSSHWGNRRVWIRELTWRFAESQISCYLHFYQGDWVVLDAIEYSSLTNPVGCRLL